LVGVGFYTHTKEKKNRNRKFREQCRSFKVFLDINYFPEDISLGFDAILYATYMYKLGPGYV